MGFSRLLSCLPASKQLELSKMESPTGYATKLNWLKRLLVLVQEERKVIEREDALIMKESDNESKNDVDTDVSANDEPIESARETLAVKSVGSESEGDEVLS